MLSRDLLRILIFLLGNINLFGQEITFSGIILSSATGDFLPYSSVYEIETRNGEITNSTGNFSFRVSSGNLTFKFSALGFHDDTFQLLIQRDTFVRIFLKTFSLPEVIISENIPLKISGSTIKFTPEALKNSVFILGEADILKSLKLYSGISPGIEGTNQFVVRGGGIDQNMLMVDGSILYNTSHLFGLISSLDPNAIKSSIFYKGAFPASIGGRLSSVLEVNLSEGNRYKSSNKISLGLITASYFTEGPIKKGKSSYMISLRTSFPSLFTQTSQSSFQSGKRDEFFSFFMHDINAKFNTDLGPKNTLFLSFYNGSDKWENGFREPPVLTRWNLNWGNQIFSIKNVSILSKSSNLITQLNYNLFKYNSVVSSNAIDEIEPSSLANKSNIIDYKAKIFYEKDLNNNFNINTGIEITRTLITPQVNFVLLTGNSSPKSNENLNSNQLAIFGSSEINLNKFGRLNLGLRSNIHQLILQNTTYFQLEPRIRYDLPLKNNIALFFTIMKINQYLHLISNPSNGYVTDVWIPVTKSLHPQSMDEISIGVDINKTGRLKNINFQVYYRNYSNQTALKPDLNIIKDEIENWEDLLLKFGKGKSFGTEIFSQYSFNKLNIITSYTLSFSRRKFTGINNGNWYNHDLDRRHIFNSNVTYRLKPNLIFNSNIVFNSGQPITIPKQASFGLDPNRPELYYVYTERNNARAPIYTRLDLGVRKQVNTPKNNVREWSFSVYNALFSKNSFLVDYTRRYQYEDFKNNLNPYFLNDKKSRSYLLFIPGISFSYAW